MRTISLVILTFLLAWTLAGCSGISDPPAASVPVPSPSPDAVPSVMPETEAPDTETSDTDGPNELQSMTLDEKLGQLIIAGMEGDKAAESTRRLIQDKHVGGVIFYKPNITDPAGLTAYVNQLRAWNRSADAPLFVSVDQEGGRVSRLPGLADFPAAADIGRSGSSEYAAAIGGLLGEASALMGMNMDFAPVLDINSNPDNPVIGDRSYGATPEIVTQLGLQAMSGIHEAGVIPVVKHFPGHGDTAVDSHLALPVIQKSLQQLQSFEWLPFKSGD